MTLPLIRRALDCADFATVPLAIADCLVVWPACDAAAPEIALGAMEICSGLLAWTLIEYDPTKRAGKGLSQGYREIFEATRKTFLEDTADIAVSHRAVRLRTLQRMATQAESMRNYALAAQLLEQAAKECGNAYTNRRELSGPAGGPIATQAKSIDLTGLSKDDRDALRPFLERLAGRSEGGAEGI